MEDAVVLERQAEQNVYILLKDPDQPIANLLVAFEEYRVVCEANGLASFGSAEKRES